MSIKVVGTNKKAYFNYYILDTLEAGMLLTGPEVKSLRLGKLSFTDSFANIKNGEVWLYNLHIAPYDYDTVGQKNYNPCRKRKLLLHKCEIKRLQSKVAEKGITLVPLKVYFNERGYAKVELGLAKGKEIVDKRETIAKREAERRILKTLKYKL